MKNEGARVVTTLYSYILDTQVQLTMLLLQSKDPIKNEGARVVITLSITFKMIKGR